MQKCSCRGTLGLHPGGDCDSCCPQKVKDAGRGQGLRAHGNIAQLGSFSAHSSPFMVELSLRLGLVAGLGGPCSTLGSHSDRSVRAVGVAPLFLERLGIQLLSPMGRDWGEPGWPSGFVHSLVHCPPPSGGVCALQAPPFPPPPFPACPGSPPHAVPQ